MTPFIIKNEGISACQFQVFIIIINTFGSPHSSGRVNQDRRKGNFSTGEDKLFLYYNRNNYWDGCKIIGKL